MPKEHQKVLKIFKKEKMPLSLGYINKKYNIDWNTLKRIITCLLNAQNIEEIKTSNGFFYKLNESSWIERSRGIFQNKKTSEWVWMYKTPKLEFSEKEKKKVK